MTSLADPAVNETATTEAQPAEATTASIPPDATAGEVSAPDAGAPQTETRWDEALAASEPIEPSSDSAIIRSALEVESELTVLDDDLEALHEKRDSLGKKIKAKDEEREEKVRELRDILRGRGQGKLPFPKMLDGAIEPPPDGPDPSPYQAPVPAEDEAWKKVTLAELGIVKPKMVELLTENDLTTLGAIAAYTADGKQKISDIKGLGKAAIQLIDDAIMSYWTLHPRKEPAPAPTDAAADAEAKPAGPEILTTETLGAQRGEIESLAHMDLLARAPYQGAGEIPVLRGTIKVNDVEHVVTQAPPELGDDVYALRPLQPNADHGVSPGDEWAGRQVKSGETVFEIGPQSQALYVRDAAK